MKAKFIFRILFLYITKVVIVINVSVARCPEFEIPCSCGSQPPYAIKYFPVDSWKLDNGQMDCIPMYIEVCETHSCSYYRDFGYPDIIYDMRKMREVVNSMEISAYPTRVVYPPLDEEQILQPKTRLRRLPKSCIDTIEPVKHATLICTLFPHFVSCDVYCSFGYAMQEQRSIVLRTTHFCDYSELHWHPDIRFPVCKPYFNCQAVLVKPGTLNCKTSGPIISYCDISCSADHSSDRIPQRRYKCTDGNYAKTLPHCATVDKTVDLIKPPNFEIVRYQVETFLNSSSFQWFEN